MATDLERAYREAAEAIMDSDFLLLSTGAGFSKDSGLAVYKDIAKIEPWSKRGLSYVGLCQPHWIETDPETFYGFWGKCFNDYRTTKPHQGYQIIKRWKEEFYRGTPTCNSFQQYWKMLHSGQSSSKKIPGNFFIYTSNVDGHSLAAGFEECEVHEIHGTTDFWQCSVPCQQVTWRAPNNLKFNIDEETLKAPTPSLDPEEIPFSDLSRSASRDLDLSNTKELQQCIRTAFQRNHPKCIFCDAPARPAILMFGDHKWISNEEQEHQSSVWMNSVGGFAKSSRSKVVILEIGCGITVPTIRYHSEQYLKRILPNGKLIRINPDYPDVRDPELKPHTISIAETGLKSLIEIDKIIRELSRNKPEEEISNVLGI